MSAFSDSLEKNADFASKAMNVLRNRFRNPKTFLATAGRSFAKSVGGPFKGTEEAIQRALHPIEGLKKGWESMDAGVELANKAKEHGFGSLKEMVAKSPEKAQQLLRAGTHHLNEPQMLESIVRGEGNLPGKAKAVAEELSRRGWTGTGTVRGMGFTKYLPVGGKAQTVGLAGMAIPNIINAEKASPTGQDAAVERGLGEMGSNLGFIAGSGLGLVPMTGLWYAGMKGGSRLGRIVDRVRSGASIGDAVAAPTRPEAEKQLETINRYYGDIK